MPHALVALELAALPPVPARAPAGTLEGAIAIGAIAGGVALLTYWWRRHTAARGPAARAVATGPRAASEAPSELRDLERDMRELTDRLAAELDARAARLERLIEAADARLVALERAAESPVAPRARAASAADPFAEVYHLADQGLPSVEIARRTSRPTGQVDLILNLRRGSVAL
jgi:hypothetical protein